MDQHTNDVSDSEGYAGAAVSGEWENMMVSPRTANLGEFVHVIIMLRRSFTVLSFIYSNSSEIGPGLTALRK